MRPVAANLLVQVLQKSRPMDQLWPDEVLERAQRERNERIVTSEIQAYLDRREAGKVS